VYSSGSLQSEWGIIEMKHPFTLLIAAFLSSVSLSLFAQDKPNILVIWGDDVGLWNISYNSRGMMGYKTPNIDKRYYSFS
jgi:arylsulfatase